MASEMAHRLARQYLRQPLIIEEFTFETADRTDWQCLPVRPVQSISASLGVAIDLDASGLGWVSAPNGGKHLIRYQAGMAHSEECLPEPIRQALERLECWIPQVTIHDELPESVQALLRPYRRH